MKEEFRKDIEGLRAVAVLPILLFHLEASFCPGGFIGVDIFFVISGFLITQMILRQGGGFSLRTFYARRFFRLFPALLATLMASLVAGWLVLGPAEYTRLAKSALAAGFGVSNFHFLAVVDYFNASSSAHPLLHTWSLGVEEQFYLVWPALVLLVIRHRLPLWFLAVSIGTLSLLAVVLLQAAYPEFVFYMMPFRMFSFAMGAGAIVLEKHWARLPTIACNLLGGIGVLLLVASFAAFDGQTPWPGLWAVIPSLATLLLLLCGSRGIWSTLLGNGAVRFVGRISYSLYLVHWPIITLYRFRSVTEPDLLELLLLGMAAVVAGAALFAAVEQPFRLRGQARSTYSSLVSLSRPIRVTGLAIGSLVFLAGASAVVFKQGFPSRLERSQVQFLDKGLTFAGDVCSTKRVRCAFGDRDSADVVFVIGDSHALNLIYGLDRLFRAAGVKGIAFYDHGCLFAYETKRFLGGVPDEKCRRNVADAYDYISRNRRPVIIANNYAGYRNEMGPAEASAPLRQEEEEYYAWLAQRLRASMDKLAANERTVVLLKQAYSTGIDLPKCLTQPGIDAKERERKCAPQGLQRVQDIYRLSDRLIDEVASAFPAAITVDPKTLFCDQERCATGDGAELFFRDAAHLTNAGSDFLVRRAEGRLSGMLARR